MTNAFNTDGPQQIDIDSALLSFNNIRIHSGPKGTSILHNPTTDGRVLVQNQVAEALQLCSVFRDLAAHKKNILQANTQLGEHHESIQAAFQQLAQAGIFESAEHCWRRLTTAQGGDSESADIRVFIITCDRRQRSGGFYQN